MPQPILRFLQELGNVDDAAKTCEIMGKGSKVIGGIVKEGLKAGKLEL